MKTTINLDKRITWMEGAFKIILKAGGTPIAAKRVSEMGKMLRYSDAINPGEYRIPLEDVDCIDIETWKDLKFAR